MLIRKPTVLLTLFVFVATGVFLLSAEGKADEKSKLAKSCGLPGCHTPSAEVLRGTLGSISGKAETIQIDTGAVWVLKFDQDTKIVGWDQAVNKIPKEKEAAITYREKDGKLYAEVISIKPAAKIKEGQLIKLDETVNLLEMGPEKGNYMLIDARPGPKYGEGYIPGAVSIFDPQFDKSKDKLPMEKDKLLVFYCAGPT